MNVPWPVLTVLVPPIVGGLLGLCLAPSKFENIVSPFLYGALMGVEITLARLLAGSGSTHSIRLLADCIVGLLIIGLLGQITLVIGILSQARYEHLQRKRTPRI
jgi:hypothetical protein